MTRVFQAFPDGLTADEADYGQARADGQLPDITLFGICSNMPALSELATANSGSDPAFAAYFPTTNAAAALHNISNDLSLCFVETCQQTRDPSQCTNECSIDVLQSSADSLNIQAGAYPCLFKLCNSSCGLPYANQDVFGVGLLASYIAQAILVLILAVALLTSASWHLFARRDFAKPSIPTRLHSSLETFLAAQCYFGISTAIAAFFLRPSTLDVLDGYALLSSAITGFIPTTFTLMLLHSHGIKSRYTTFLTFTTWLFSSILFFLLIRDLTVARSNPRAIDRGLSSLFPVNSCGASSAMSLCKQTFDTDPLIYLDWFLNYWSIPNIKTVPVLWVLSTVVLLCLVALQFLDNRPSHKINARVRLASLYLGSLLFGLALGYQTRMIQIYTAMDVIDWDGWTFGQVVALLFWVPPLVDCFRSYFMESNEKLIGSNGVTGNGYAHLGASGKPAPQKSLSSLTLTQLQHSPTVSPDSSLFRLSRVGEDAYEPLRLSPDQGLGLRTEWSGRDVEMARITRKPVGSTRADSAQ